MPSSARCTRRRKVGDPLIMARPRESPWGSSQASKASNRKSHQADQAENDDAENDPLSIEQGWVSVIMWRCPTMSRSKRQRMAHIHAQPRTSRETFRDPWSGGRGSSTRRINAVIAGAQRVGRLNEVAPCFSMLTRSSGIIWNTEPMKMTREWSWNRRCGREDQQRQKAEAAESGKGERRVRGRPRSARRL